MRVTIDGIEFRFWFKHTPTSTSVMCTTDRSEHVYEAATTLAPSDVFCKATGRKVALTRLLKKGLIRLTSPDPPIPIEQIWDVYFTRESRKLIWAEYFKQHADLRK